MALRQQHAYGSWPPDLRAQHRHRQRGLTVLVFRFEVRAQIDQQIQDVVTASADREMQRCLPLFERRQAAIERLRILLRNLPNEITSPMDTAEKMWWRAPRSTSSAATSGLSPCGNRESLRQSGSQKEPARSSGKDGDCQPKVAEVQVLTELANRSSLTCRRAKVGGVDGTRTRGLRRDRAAF